MTGETKTGQRKKLAPGLKFALEMGPLVLFFVAYSRFGIFAGTGVLMVATVAALAVTYSLTKHLPVMPLVTAVMVLVFGGLTLILHDATFVKMKATIVYLLFAAALLGGLAVGKALLSVAFDSVMRLTERWRAIASSFFTSPASSDRSGRMCSVMKCMARPGLPQVRSKASNSFGGRHSCSARLPPGLMWTR